MTDQLTAGPDVTDMARHTSPSIYEGPVSPTGESRQNHPACATQAQHRTRFNDRYPVRSTAENSVFDHRVHSMHKQVGFVAILWHAER